MKNGNILLFFMFLCFIFSCKHSITNPGIIPLEEFTLKNKSLDSIARNVLTQLNVDTCQEVVVLDLMWVNHERTYLFSFQRKSDLMEKYISWNNRRIVGYTTIGEYLTIILSNVDNHRSFLDIFASDLDIGENTKEFVFIHVLKNKYRWISVEGQRLPWQNKAYLYEPIFVVCKPKEWSNYEISYTNSPFLENNDYGDMNHNHRFDSSETKRQRKK